MIIDEHIYVEHFGVKGQKWGVRKNRAVKGVKKTGRFVKEHPKTTASVISAGAVFVSALLIRNGRNRPFDYDYSYPTVDIGPMGLNNFRFPSS